MKHDPSQYPIETMLHAVSLHTTQWPRAAMFELAVRGHDTLFEQLVSCILSVRTKDEDALPASLALFAQARTPAAMAALSVQEILKLTHEVSYAPRKAYQIQEMAQHIESEHGGQVPADDDIVRGLKGIGPKCANLALGIAAGLPRISVDTHVHRVVNRWGLVDTKKPEQTLKALDQIIDDEHKVDINRLLMPFGKHHCTLYRPKCGTCPVRRWCKRRFTYT